MGARLPRRVDARPLRPWAASRHARQGRRTTRARSRTRPIRPWLLSPRPRHFAASPRSRARWRGCLAGYARASGRGMRRRKNSCAREGFTGARGKVVGASLLRATLLPTNKNSKPRPTAPRRPQPPHRHENHSSCPRPDRRRRRRLPVRRPRPPVLGRASRRPRRRSVARRRHLRALRHDARQGGQTHRDREVRRLDSRHRQVPGRLRFLSGSPSRVGSPSAAGSERSRRACVVEVAMPSRKLPCRPCSSLRA